MEIREKIPGSEEIRVHLRHPRTNSAISSVLLFTVAWVLMMISIPIIRWVIGDEFLPFGVMAGVILQSCAVLASLQQAWGARAIVQLVIFIVPVTWLLEYIGSTQGIPFGNYHYTTSLQPQLGGVPLIIPLAWLMMLPPSWAVAHWMLRSSRWWQHGDGVRRRFLLAALSGLAITAWDLFLDPQMVGWGYWVWAQPGLYFGIPLVNFFGWWISATLVSLLLFLLLHRQFSLSHLTFVFPQTLLLIYAITWLLQSIGQSLFWGQPGPAAVGFVAMGIFVGIALRNYYYAQENPAK